MMRATTWMDAGEALREGFIDGIVDMGSGVVNAAFFHETSLAEAKEKVAAWMERSRPACLREAIWKKGADDVTASAPVVEEESKQEEQERQVSPEAQPAKPGIPAAQLLRRLELITPNKR